MNQENLDKLMDGVPNPKWAELTPQEAKLPAAELKAVVKEKEKIIPIDVARAVSDYVELQRIRHVPERMIRREVKRKWNIQMEK